MELYPSRLMDQPIKEHMTCFLTDDNTIKGRVPNINMINSIHKIKDKTSINLNV